MAFRMTSAAAREVLDAAARGGAEGMALRVAAKATTEGVTFGMGFDDEAPGDQVVECEGVMVVIAPASRPLLEGLVLDIGPVEGGEREFLFMDASAR